MDDESYNQGVGLGRRRAMADVRKAVEDLMRAAGGLPSNDALPPKLRRPVAAFRKAATELKNLVRIHGG